MSANALIDLSLSNIDVKMTDKLFGKFDADIDIGLKTDINELISGTKDISKVLPRDFHVKIALKQEMFAYLEHLCEQAAKEIEKSAKYDLDKANNELQKAKESFEKLDKLKKKLDAARKECLGV